MKKELIVIIVCILLVGSVLPVAGNIIKTISNDIIKSDYDINHPRNPNYSYSYEETGFLDISDFTKTTGGPDIAVFRFFAWFSPIPWLENKSYLSYTATLVNLGEKYSGNGTIDEYIYLIYSDNETLLEHTTDCLGEWDTGFYSYATFTRTSVDSEKPLKIRIELHPSFPDVNLRNNKKTVAVNMGVTIDGKVYKKDSSGNREPINKANVRCNSDVLSAPLFTGCGISWDDGYYCLCSPKSPWTASFKYTIKASLVKGGHGYNRVQWKKTAPLSEYDYASVDFEFLILKSKSINNRSYQCFSMFQRFIEMFPILQRIFNLIK